MSWGTPKIEQPKKTAGLDEESFNTNQEAIPVTYIAGRRRVPLIFHTPVYNQVNEAVKTKAGKGSDSTVTGYIYYVDIAGLICICSGRTPLDAIFKHIFDLEEVWTGSLARGSNPSDPITIARFGATWIYWGREDQPIDSHVLTPKGPLPGGVNPRVPSTWPDYDQTGDHPEP